MRAVWRVRGLTGVRVGRVGRRRATLLKLTKRVMNGDMIKLYSMILSGIGAGLPRVVA